ncbi:acyltransferase family protein [Noviherbaspirillum sedimenti]|uniref:Acyltransferase n=1 Tax=Noviherbaspirillum sedimenti TaxID=2320865 RepID=A0A3A3GI29_9BURK|nr:acyltransferase [Noviherbaspirillum sedimenti]RJG01926.1 acyltransferase [Noviherbaspirillum sedimenti]
MATNLSGLIRKAGTMDGTRNIVNLFANLPTVATVLEKNRGAGPGFDALRIGLALCILLFHSIQNSYGSRYSAYVPTFFYPIILALLPMFFCLSGFLVTGSALRTRSVPLFLTYRGLRIFPALAVEVTLCALLLGPLLTTVPLKNYFSDHQFFEYFGNIISIVRYTLPGVFADNPVPHIVNIALWTLRPEFHCYFAMSLLMLSSIVYRPTLYTRLFLAASVYVAILNVVNGFGNPTSTFPWHVILYYFFIGIAFFHWKEHIPLHFSLFAAAAILSYFLLPLDGTTYVAAFPLTYCMVYLGTLKIPRVPLLQNGDYSYGIYLFHFPIQQTLIHFFPGLREWWLLFPVAATLTILFAAASWHWIEKPSLSLKKHFDFLRTWRIGRILPADQPR